jgi:hypothetical protein
LDWGCLISDQIASISRIIKLVRFVNVLITQLSSLFNNPDLEFLAKLVLCLNESFIIVNYILLI